MKGVAVSEIPIPPRMQANLRWRGLPVPFLAIIGADGAPDFRVVDELKRGWVAAQKRCQLCGELLGRAKFFTGGPNAAKAMLYFEPPAHLDCLVYAMQVCPFIVGKIEHADPAKVAAEHAGLSLAVDTRVLPARAPEWVIVKATDYTLTRLGPQGWHFVPCGRVYVHPPVVPETMSADEWRAVEAELRAA